MVDMNYSEWLRGLDAASMKYAGFPWNAWCCDTKTQREAYAKGVKPDVFIKEYLQHHKPCNFVF